MLDCPHQSANLAANGANNTIRRQRQPDSIGCFYFPLEREIRRYCRVWANTIPARGISPQHLMLLLAPGNLQ